MDILDNPLDQTNIGQEEDKSKEDFDLTAIDEALNDEPTEIEESNEHVNSEKNVSTASKQENIESEDAKSDSVDNSNDGQESVDYHQDESFDKNQSECSDTSEIENEQNDITSSKGEKDFLSEDIVMQIEETTESKEFLKLDEISSEIMDLQNSLGKFQDYVLTVIQDSKKKENAVTVLSDTLKEYKILVEEKLVKSCFREIIGVRDSMIHTSREIEKKSEGEPQISLSTFLSFSDDLETILYNNDVETYRSKVGDKFDPKKQRVLRKIAVDNESMHGIIVESISDGYMYSGRVISPEKVVVYFFSKS